MPRFTRRSQASDAVDDTQGSSFDPLLSLQPIPKKRSANDLSGGKKRTYSSYEASNSHVVPATPHSSPKTQPTPKRPRKRVPIAVRRETRGSSKENRGHALGTDGESERDDGIDVATGRRASFIPHRDDTHSTQRSSTDFINHNAFDFSNVESEVEEEGDWHDDLTSKENPGPSMRVSEAMSSERASWGSDSISSPGPASQNTRGSGDTIVDGDGSSPGGADAGSTPFQPENVRSKWPRETDMDFRDGRTRIRLMNQSTIVRMVLQDAIENMHAFLVFRSAFPDPNLVAEGAKAALMKAARGRFPGASPVHDRLISDEEYNQNMTVIPRARIPIIRNSIKDRCAAMVAAEYTTLDSAIKIPELVAKEKQNYNYIYPVVKFGVPLKDRMVKRSQPYRNQRIINVIRSLYFSGGASSFAKWYNYMFARYRDDEGFMKPMVPDAMVALVATGVYSAVLDWRNGKKEPVDFTTGTYLDVYDGNINTLKNMRLNHPNKYNTMMADIYARVSSTEDGSTAIQIADIPIDELDG